MTKTASNSSPLAEWIVDRTSRSRALPVSAAGLGRIEAGIVDKALQILIAVHDALQLIDILRRLGKSSLYSSFEDRLIIFQDDFIEAGGLWLLGQQVGKKPGKSGEALLPGLPAGYRPGPGKGSAAPAMVAEIFWAVLGPT